MGLMATQLDSAALKADISYKNWGWQEWGEWIDLTKSHNNSYGVLYSISRFVLGAFYMFYNSKCCQRYISVCVRLCMLIFDLEKSPDR